MTGTGAARIDIYRRSDELPMASLELVAESSTQLLSDGKRELLRRRDADYARITWQGRTLTIDRDTSVLGAR